MGPEIDSVTWVIIKTTGTWILFYFCLPSTINLRLLWKSLWALFELESSSVTSVWSQQTLWETDRQPDPKIGPQIPGCDENGKVCVGEATPTSRILQAQSFFFLFCSFSVTLRPQGWIKVRLTVLFRTDSFRTQTDLQTVSEMFTCDRQFWTKQMQKIMMAWY